MHCLIHNGECGPPIEPSPSYIHGEYEYDSTRESFFNHIKQIEYINRILFQSYQTN